MLPKHLSRLTRKWERILLDQEMTIQFCDIPKQRQDDLGTATYRKYRLLRTDWAPLESFSNLSGINNTTVFVIQPKLMQNQKQKQTVPKLSKQHNFQSVHENMTTNLQQNCSKE